MTIPPSQKLCHITSRAERRMVEGRVMREEYLVPSGTSELQKELCLTLNYVVTCGIDNSSISTGWSSKKILEKESFKRKF